MATPWGIPASCDDILHSGFAPTEVKIDGVVHEYDRVEGMREDIVMLLLNLKKVVFKLKDSTREVMRIDKVGPCQITAGDIDRSHNVEIIDGNVMLATLTDEAKLGMNCRRKRCWLSDRFNGRRKFRKAFWSNIFGCRV